jgi:hypothetical protein
VSSIANRSDEQKARLLLEFLAQPLGKLFHLFQSCIHQHIRTEHLSNKLDETANKIVSALIRPPQ